MTKTVTYTCEITVMQTKDMEVGTNDNTCLVEVTADDPATQKVLDTNPTVALASTGQLLSLAVATIIMEESVKRGLTTEQMLAEFVMHVANHVVGGGERTDPEIFNFDINS